MVSVRKLLRMNILRPLHKIALVWYLPRNTNGFLSKYSSASLDPRFFRVILPVEDSQNSV